MIVIRRYEPHDRAACRLLWSELVAHHRELYDDSTTGGSDPGDQFDEHLRLVGADRVWIAELDGSVVGMAATVPQGQKAELEPVVVSSTHRRGGYGRRLVEAAVTDARDRGADQVYVRPVGRNTEAIRFFQAVGFGVVARVELTDALRSAPPRTSDFWAGTTLLS
jgi:N-acetylglutamate synthase-like GNAT family acetyltransferase